MNTRLSSFLNASRWWAAFLVAASHLRHLVLIDSTHLKSPAVLLRVFYLMTSLGNEAVMVFFVISGYLVGGQIVVHLHDRGFSVRDYAINRISRIYTVLVPALVVGGSFDLVGYTLFNKSGLYTVGARYDTFLNFPIASNLSISAFVGNLFMVEDIVTPRLGSNTPLWSLAYEWWYYCIFAVGIMLVTKRQILIRAIAFLCALIMIKFLPHPLVFWLTIWLIGIAAAKYEKTSSPRPPLWLGFILLSLSVLISRLTTHSETSGSRDSLASFERNVLVALSYAILMLAYSEKGAPVKYSAIYKRLASFSYTLYLVHVPFALLIICIANDVFRIPFLREPSFAAVSEYSIIFAFLVSFAYGFSLCTEAKTVTVRSLLHRYVSKGSQLIAKKVPNPT